MAVKRYVLRYLLEVLSYDEYADRMYAWDKGFLARVLDRVGGRGAPGLSSAEADRATEMLDSVAWGKFSPTNRDDVERSATTRDVADFLLVALDEYDPPDRWEHYMHARRHVPVVPAARSIAGENLSHSGESRSRIRCGRP